MERTTVQRYGVESSSVFEQAPTSREEEGGLIQLCHGTHEHQIQIEITRYSVVEDPSQISSVTVDEANSVEFEREILNVPTDDCSARWRQLPSGSVNFPVGSEKRRRESPRSFVFVDAPEALSLGNPIRRVSFPEYSDSKASERRCRRQMIEARQAIRWEQTDGPTLLTSSCLTRAISETALTLSVNFLWSNLTFRRLNSQTEIRRRRSRWKVTARLTCVSLGEIFFDAFELWMYSHIWQVLCIYKSTKFHVKHLLRHFSTGENARSKSGAESSRHSLVWSIGCPSWSYVHVFLHGSVLIYGREQRPSLPYRRRPNQTEWWRIEFEKRKSLSWRSRQKSHLSKSIITIKPEATQIARPQYVLGTKSP